MIINNFNRKVFILPRVAELFIHKEKQRGCPLLGANKYIHIYIKYICVYTSILFICLRLSKAFPHHQSVYFIQCEAWEKVLESVSRQARLQRVLMQRLRNPWTQLKSHIVVFNQVEFQHVTVLRKMQWGLVQRPKSAIYSFRTCGWMDGCVLSFFSSTIFSTPLHRLK